jgi:RHS repeat-associated protein
LAEGTLAGTYSVSTTYNPHTGSLDSVSYPAAHGLPAETVTYGYDSLNYPTTLTGLQTYITSTSYTTLGQLAQRVYGPAGPGQLTRDYTWDPASGRLAAITGKVPDSAAPGNLKTVQDDSYIYNATGDVTAIRDNTDGQSQCYSYDPQHRLTEAWTTLGTCATAPTAVGVATSGKYPYWDSWTFDTAGRRATDTRRTATTSTSRSYAYPATGADRPHAMTSVTRTGSQTGTDNFTYDTGGNMATRTVAGQTTDLTFDAEGRYSRAVVHATDGDQETRHLYDAGGNLLVRREPGKTTMHIGEQEFTLVGTAVSCQRYYSAGATVAVRTAAGVTWIAADHQGSATLAVNQATGQVDKRWYTPYGADRGGAASWPTDRGFLGAPTNGSTGLVHLGAREYDPTHGVFISPDPLIRWSSPQSLNAYDYAHASPVTASDPTGLDPLDPGQGIKGRHSDAHQVAVWLRVQRIMELYPGATNIYGSPVNWPGADIICWDCEDGKILIWEVKPRGDTSVDLAKAAKKLEGDPQAQAMEGRTVAIGPPLSEPKGDQTGYLFGLKQFVTVSSSPTTAGLEEYTVTKDDNKDEEKTANAIAEIRAAEDVVAKRPHPTVPDYAPNGRRQDLQRRHLLNEPGSEHPQDVAANALDPRPKDPGAVVGGSFLGDVALFTGAIVVVYVACRFRWVCSQAASKAGRKSSITKIKPPSGGAPNNVVQLPVRGPRSPLKAA